jgi:prevent-host-death family protein
MTATEASRSFSDLLTRVAGGDEVEITRAGETVAVIGPPKPPMFLPPDRWNELVGSFGLGEEWAQAVEEAQREANATMPGSPWES